MPTPISSPTISETKNQLADRALEPRSPWRAVWVGRAAGDELAVPTQQCLRLDREGCPGRPGKRPAQHRQQRPISPRQPRPRRLAAEDRQLVAQHEDLQLLRATRPPQQPDQREQVPDNEIHERPEQTALPPPQHKAMNLASPTPRRTADEFANPTGLSRASGSELARVRLQPFTAQTAGFRGRQDLFL